MLDGQFPWKGPFQIVKNSFKMLQIEKQVRPTMKDLGG